MPARTLKIPAEIRNLIRQMHPHLKRKVRAGLKDILEDPACGKALKEELEGYWSLPVGRTRIIYRPAEGIIEVVAIGPRATIYLDAFRETIRDKEKS